MGSRRTVVKVFIAAIGAVPLLAHVGRAFASSHAKDPVWNGIQRTSAITCPSCGHSVNQAMSSESLRKVYHCPKCLKWVATKKGDHCIYDSYGSVNCPARQLKAKLKAKG